jgi:pyrroloquinoline quinone (PQQ) biosynthesis protein C
MKEVGAETEQVERFVRELEAGESVTGALRQVGVAEAVTAFVRSTFEVIERGQPHEIAAAFTYGREDLIPEMFTQLVHGLERQFPGRLDTLRYYLDRHIELDGDEHGEMGRQMVDLLCGGDAVREAEALSAALEALESRRRLWDAIALEVGKRRQEPMIGLALTVP